MPQERSDTIAQTSESPMLNGERFDVGAIRVRLVEYSAGFIADPWCEKGHILRRNVVHRRLTRKLTRLANIHRRVRQRSLHE